MGDKQTIRFDAVADYAEQRRDRAWRAWLAVRAPEAVAVLDAYPNILDMLLDDFRVYGEAIETHQRDLTAALALVEPVILVATDRTPRAMWRDGSTMGDCWVAAGHSLDDLERIVEKRCRLRPEDDSDHGVRAFLWLNGWDETRIRNWLADNPAPGEA